MKRGVSLLISVLASAGAIAQQGPVQGGPGAASQPQLPPPFSQPASPNPALLYWQAVAMLPEVSATDIKMISDVLAGGIKVDEASVGSLLQRTRKSLDRFARAAASPAPCVWGTTFDEGPFAPMPHLPKMQILCRLALVRAAAEFARGLGDEALQWIMHVHRAARHVASDRLLTTFVMQHGMEQQAIRLTARHVMTIDAGMREEHLRALKALGPPSLLREALDGERAVSEYLMRMVVGMEGVAIDEKEMLEAAEKVLRAQADKAEQSAPGSAQPALAMVEQWKLTVEQSRAMHTALQAASLKPWPDFEKDMQQIRTDIASAPSSVLGTLQGVSGARRKELETQTLRLMLEAALARGESMVDGDLEGTNDAFFGKTFTVSRDRDVLKMLMKDAVRGKVLTLDFSK